MWVLIALGIIALLIGLWVLGLHQQSKNTDAAVLQIQHDFQAALSAEYGFEASSIYVSRWSGAGIAHDRVDDRIGLLGPKVSADGRGELEVFAPRQILASEIEVDGRTVTRYSSGSVAGRGIVGGILAGNAGAVVGGLSSDAAASEQVSRVTLVVLVDDADEPRREVIFFSTLRGFADLHTARALMDHAYGAPEPWHDRLRVVMSRASRPTDQMDLGRQLGTSD